MHKSLLNALKQQGGGQDKQHIASVLPASDTASIRSHTFAVVTGFIMSSVLQNTGSSTTNIVLIVISFRCLFFRSFDLQLYCCIGFWDTDYP